MRIKWNESKENQTLKKQQQGRVRVARVTCQRRGTALSSPDNNFTDQQQPDRHTYLCSVFMHGISFYPPVIDDKI